MAVGPIEHGGQIFESRVTPLFRSEEYDFGDPDVGLSVMVTASTQANSRSGTLTGEHHLELSASAGRPVPDGDEVVLAKVVLAYTDMNYPPAPEQQELYADRIMHAAKMALTAFTENPRS